MITILVIMSMSACGETNAWNCPQCGRTDNTGNYCGECAYPAPWIEDGASTISAVKAVEAGDYVTFGHYPQTVTGNDNTPIEWLVLDVQDNKALMISRYGLDCRHYHSTSENITWEKCSLRVWLNNDFLNAAFTALEQKGIVLTTVDNSQAQGFDYTIVYSRAEKTNGGNNTQDKIFLLSYAEANRYFGVTWKGGNNKKSRVTPTAYAQKTGAWTSESNTTADGAWAGWWWLRSPGNFQHSAADVSYDGSLYYADFYDVRGCVRPALWVDLMSDLKITDKTPLVTVASEPQSFMIVTMDEAYIRTRPSADNNTSRILDKVSSGQYFTAYERVASESGGKDWYRILYDGQTAYISTTKTAIK